MILQGLNVLHQPLDKFDFLGLMLNPPKVMR